MARSMAVIGLLFLVATALQAAPFPDAPLPLDMALLAEPGMTAELANYRNNRGLGMLFNSLIGGGLFSNNNLFNGNSYTTGNNLYDLYNPYAYYGLGYRPYAGSLGGSYLGYFGR